MRAFVTITALSLVLMCRVAAADGANPPDVSMTAAEREFAESMTGATLVGSFTAGPVVPGDASTAPKPERYELGEVRKVGDGQWLLTARIRYGDHDVTLPLTLPVEWAGDTAVIVVDKVGFPGLGEYSARVLIHGGRYAGYWHGGDHGGHLFGEIRTAEDKREAAEG